MAPGRRTDGGFGASWWNFVGEGGTERVGQGLIC